jgi:hypothetical protein
MKCSHTVFLVILSCAACSIYKPVPSEWPDNIPSRSYFVEYFQKDPEHQKIVSEQEYLTWIHRFYFGWELYRRGWLQATDELVDTLNSNEDKVSAKRKSLLIGKLVAPEWAKDKRHRVINTRHLSTWGNSLMESKLRNEQLVILDRILIDVRDLLSYKIKPEDIKGDRYYSLDPFPTDFE